MKILSVLILFLGAITTLVHSEKVMVVDSSSDVSEISSVRETIYAVASFCPLHSNVIYGYSYRNSYRRIRKKNSSFHKLKMIVLYKHVLTRNLAQEISVMFNWIKLLVKLRLLPIVSMELMQILILMVVVKQCGLKTVQLAVPNT